MTIEPTTIKPTTIAPIIFSHDSNPFDSASISFLISNLNVTKPNVTSLPFNGSPVSKWANVIPLPKLISGYRQKRIHVFRPLFVYRQEQAQKKRASAKPSIDPDRYYNRPQYPYYYPHAPPPPPPYPYPSDLYNIHYPDYVPNDLSIAGPLPPPPPPPYEWYAAAPHYAWPPHGYFP